MKYCYLCGSELFGKNITKEHIIPNAIGGKLKSTNLICRTCNSKLGEKIDSAFSEQCTLFCNMLNIQRDRGIPKSIKTSNSEGKEYILHPDGRRTLVKPEIKIEENGNETRFKISAKDMKNVRSILESLKEKYPQIDVNSILKEAKKEKEYSDQWHNFQQLKLGGVNAFRSICKTAANLYILKGNSSEHISQAKDFINIGDMKKNCVNFYYPEKPIILKNNDEILHSIIIVGSSSEKILYAYAEFFNMLKFLVVLNNNYNGSDLVYSYFFDLLMRVEVSKDCELSLRKEQVMSCIDCKKMPLEGLQKASKELFPIIMKKQQKLAISDIVSDSFKSMKEKHPEADCIDSENFDEFMEILKEHMEPYLLNELKKAREKNERSGNNN
jgi:hypothetical protein